MSSFCTPHAALSDDHFGTVALLILGVGLLALFAGFEHFSLIFLWFGYAILVPLIAIYIGIDSERGDDERTDTEHATDVTPPSGTQTPTNDALAVLRERYARGGLTDE